MNMFIHPFLASMSTANKRGMQPAGPKFDMLVPQAPHVTKSEVPFLSGTSVCPIPKENRMRAQCFLIHTS